MEEKTKFQVGDKVIVLKRYHSSSIKINIGDESILSFVGKHNGTFKIMTPELDAIFPTKNGWFYETDFQLISSAEPIFNIF